MRFKSGRDCVERGGAHAEILPKPDNQGAMDPAAA